MYIKEETDDCGVDNGVLDKVGGSTMMAKRGLSSSPRRRCRSMGLLKSPAVAVPSMMILDLILGLSLNLLRNVPGFRFPLCYALTQKLTNALAWQWEAEYLARRHPTAKGNDKAAASTTMTGLPSARSLRRHAAPLAWRRSELRAAVDTFAPLRPKQSLYSAH